MRENIRNPAPPASSKAKPKTNGTNGLVSNWKTRSKTKSSDDKIWDFPASGNTLNVLMTAQADVFELELGSIRPLEESSQEEKRASRVKTSNLRHDLPAWEIPCKIDLRMWEGDEPTGRSFVGDGITDRGQKDKALFVRKEVHEAMARGFVTNSKNGSTRLKIDMDEPLKVNTGPLVARSSAQPKFLIEVFVWFEDRVRSKILLEEICGQTMPRYQRVEPFARIVALQEYANGQAGVWTRGDDALEFTSLKVGLTEPQLFSTPALTELVLYDDCHSLIKGAA
ncbi:MAG: hypothetical protein Q9157_005495 [Trypethelium eluteriae]